MEGEIHIEVTGAERKFCKKSLIVGVALFYKRYHENINNHFRTYYCMAINLIVSGKYYLSICQVIKDKKTNKINIIIYTIKGRYNVNILKVRTP